MADEYSVTVGAPSVTAPSYNSDEALAIDLAKTCDWMQECILEYEELEPKLDKNARWFATHDTSHQKYLYYEEIFNDQKEIAHALLDRLESYRKLGIGEIARMSQDGEKKYKSHVDLFFSLSDWVRSKRNEVAEKEGIPF